MALNQRLGTSTEDMPRIITSVQKDSHHTRKNMLQLRDLCSDRNGRS